MTDLVPVSVQNDDLVSTLTHAHGLGPVADDWQAAQVWLDAIATRGRKNSAETVATYGYHLDKVRWFCENVHPVTPSRWTMQDVDAFCKYLADVPEDAICARDPLTGAFASRHDPGYSPFRKQPAISSQADIKRFVHAMFRAWRDMGYIHINPMALHGAGTMRKINPERAVSIDLYDMVFEAMDAEEKRTFTARQLAARDRFILIALRELGLRASELIKASMSAFYKLSDPQDKRTYWVMRIGEETSKGRKERKLPVPKVVMAALGVYREAFGMAAEPSLVEKVSLILSVKTDRTKAHASGRVIKDVESRRFFQAWLPVATRHGLYHIVKGRLEKAAKILDEIGEPERAAHLRRASTHWLRHTFAKAALLTGQDVRTVAAWLGHSDLATTMIYTEQEALDLIRASNDSRPDFLAAE
ncbi:tyrosine-type recombinase/integrase [Duganella violaceipulchra]|uniref:Site-specific integrase n=1 Tax=Duganella violaceipulchra TaxID=2849652 RepID=A0AA41HF49_9BURK|nr:site-specific integrase [Duganella violaceicalia]MCP2012710.1 site-specific recombinase XerD [Duganella violaceicalia]